MKKSLLLLITLTLFTTVNVLSQTLINGVTYRLNGANTATTAVTQTNLIGANSDQVASAVTPIGFTFWFAGTPYTDFSVNENGLMTLGTTQILGSESNNLMASATTLPKIAPYWDDLATGTTGYVGYQLTGIAPNRILRVKWFVTVPKNAAGAANAMFQAELYEQTMSIHFAFGTTYPAVNANGYSMGVGVAANDFCSVTVTGNTFPVANYGTAIDNNTMAPGGASVKRYQFGTDYTAPTISTQTIPNAPGSANRILTKTITDLTPYNGTGVPLAGNLMPRIYYKKGVAGTWVSTQGAFVSGTNINGTWDFTVDHSLVGGVLPGDQIYYYVIAQDQSNAFGYPNISSYPAGVVAIDVNNVTTPPAAPSMYTVGYEFSGIIAVGTGGNFASLSNTGGIFEMINGGMLTGNLIINIISDLPSEAGTVALNAWINGPGGPFTLTIKPDGGARTVTGSAIRLTGTTGVLIDGLNDGINSLTLNSTSGTAVTLTGASNNIVTRTTVKGAGSSGGGVIVFSNSTTPCSNNTISWCNITSSNPASPSYHGIFFTGLITPAATGNVIDHNTFTNFSYFAIHKGYTTTSQYVNFTISNNEIYNTVAVSERQYYKAICLESTSGQSNIFNNKIHDLLVSFSTSSGAYVSAINTTNTASDVTNIYNNVIYLDATVNHPLQAWYGIDVANAGTSNIYYNSIHIAGSSTNNSIARGIVKSAVGNANVKNNIVYISRTGSANGALVLSGTFTQSNNFITDPGFTSPTNLIPTNYALNAGIPIAGITNDIAGVTRDAVAPTIGAYEISHATLSLTLNVLLEGLYAGAGTMTQAFDANGPHWPAGVADHITVELRDAANYAVIVLSADVALSTAGIATMEVTPNYNGNYFITVKHRNSIETTTPTALSFAGSTVTHDFTSSAAQAYGNNLKQSGAFFLIYAGDVNQDGSIDTGDMLPVDNNSFNYLTGYLSSDVNGDGATDTGDMIFVDNNSSLYIGAMHP